MGPGHGGPGEILDLGDLFDVMEGLQWGRATEGPERSLRKRSTSRVLLASMGPGHGGPGEIAEEQIAEKHLALQWGRATEGPESPLGTPISKNRPRFNGAGPRRARRAVRRENDRSPQVCFNGAGPRRARRAERSRDPQGFSKCFNGAGPRRARRGSDPLSLRGRDTSFNGAGPRRARRA